MPYVAHDSTHTAQTSHTIEFTWPCPESMFPQLSVSLSIYDVQTNSWFPVRSTR